MTEVEREEQGPVTGEMVARYPKCVNCPGYEAALIDGICDGDCRQRSVRNDC